MSAPALLYYVGGLEEILPSILNAVKLGKGQA